MRNAKWLVAAGLALATTGCVESMDAGYPSGGGYYGDSGYYAEAPTTYYAPYYEPTRVVTQTRYVPVPVAVPERTHTQQTDRSNDRRSNDQQRWASHNDNHQQPQASQPQHSQPQPSSSQASNRGSNSRRTPQDRDGDGKPDRHS